MGYQKHSSILLTPHKTCEIKREADIKLIDASITEIATLEVKLVNNHLIYYPFCP